MIVPLSCTRTGTRTGTIIVVTGIYFGGPLYNSQVFVSKTNASELNCCVLVEPPKINTEESLSGVMAHILKPSGSSPVVACSVHVSPSNVQMPRKVCPIMLSPTVQAACLETGPQGSLSSKRVHFIVVPLRRQYNIVQKRASTFEEDVDHGVTWQPLNTCEDQDQYMGSIIDLLFRLVYRHDSCASTGRLCMANPRCQ
jgi:hypothetical protein